MGNLLVKEDLLRKEVLKIEKVTFDDGNFVFVREMTGRERNQWETLNLKKVRDGKGNITFEQNTDDMDAKIACLTVCDESGKNLLTANDYLQLSLNMGAKRLGQIALKAREVNGLTIEAMEEKVKNSELGQQDSSTSGSAEG